jgi:fatty-acyl-CoA synthase
MPIRVATPAQEAYRYPLLIKQLLHTPLISAADQEIIYRDVSRYTYTTLSARIAKLARGLARLGVEAGTTVAVMDWDSHRYLESFFAIPMMGAVLHTVNVRLSPDQIAYTLRHAGARVLLVHRDFIPTLSRIRSQLPALLTIILIADGAAADSDSHWIVTEYEELLDSSRDGYEFQEFDENAIATTFYTTGTTGDPKGVCFSHRQVVLHTLGVLAACGTPAYGQSFRHGDVYMPMTPMFHVHAWGNPYVATVLGVKQVYPGRYVPEELLRLRVRESVTFSHCVPTILKMLLSSARELGTDLHGWKMCIGGAALTKGLAREALEAGIDVYAGYGMSETCPALTISRLTKNPEIMNLERELDLRCHAGLPVPLVELRVIDAEQAPVPRDGHSVGEIVARAPWLTPCYVGNASASEQLWRGGYLHTQDVGLIDPSGYLQITDRIKDVIKSGGEWISSLQLETLISMHPAVAEAAVVAVSDSRWGERPHALIVPRPEHRSTLTSEDIRLYVATAATNGSVPPYAVPERVTIVEALERTSVGKVDKRRLREMYP